MYSERSKMMNQMGCLLLGFILLLFIQHTPTQMMQVNAPAKIYMKQFGESIIMALPKQEIISTIGHSIRKVHMSITVYLKQKGYTKEKLIKWKSIVCYYKFQCYHTCIIEYIHCIDGKKRTLYRESNKSF